MIEYADKFGAIYSDEDIKEFNAEQMNALGLHKVDEDWCPYCGAKEDTEG